MSMGARQVLYDCTLKCGWIDVLFFELLHWTVVWARNGPELHIKASNATEAPEKLHCSLCIDFPECGSWQFPSSWIVWRMFKKFTKCPPPNISNQLLPSGFWPWGLLTFRGCWILECRFFAANGILMNIPSQQSVGGCSYLGVADIWVSGQTRPKGFLYLRGVLSTKASSAHFHKHYHPWHVWRNTVYSFFTTSEKHMSFPWTMTNCSDITVQYWENQLSQRPESPLSLIVTPQATREVSRITGTIVFTFPPTSSSLTTIALHLDSQSGT